MPTTRAQAVPILVLTLLGMFGLCRYLFLAITRGYTTGKLGAIHYAGTLSYAGSIGGMVLGLVFGGVLLWMCWRWMSRSDLS